MINFSELLWKPRPGAESRTLRRTQLERVETLTTLPEIAEVEVRLTPKSRIPVATDPSGTAADRFRLLRMRLWELRSAARVQNVLITSPLPQDGKSTVAINLATSLAEGGKRSVLLLECDFHRPMIAPNLGVPLRAGAAGCVEDGLDPLAETVKVNPLGWYFLQAGSAKSISELFQGNGLEKLIEDCRQHFEWIVIDTPPLLALTDAVALSKSADTSLLVTRMGRTPRKAVQEAMRLLGPKQIFGVIANGEENIDKAYSSYGRYYR